MCLAMQVKRLHPKNLLQRLRTIDADAISEMGVCENLGAIRDGERCTTTAACCIILFFDGRDRWLG